MKEGGYPRRGNLALKVIGLLVLLGVAGWLLGRLYNYLFWQFFD